MQNSTQIYAQPAANGTGPVQAFTASRIAAVLGRTPQAIRKALRDVKPAGAQIVAGNEAATWTVDQLPASLRARLDDEAKKQRCIGFTETQRIETLLSLPRRQWPSPIPLDKIHDDVIKQAEKLRDALKPWLIPQSRLGLTRKEWERRGIEDYQRLLGNRITTRYWRKLMRRAEFRDAGAEEWNRLENYLPDRLKEKNPAPKPVPGTLTEDFAEIQSFITACTNPRAPNEAERLGVWTLAFKIFTALVKGGAREKSAARRVRQFLFARVRSLAASRNALLKAFNRKLDALTKSNGDLKALRDGRERNGNRAEYPIEDIERVRHSAALKNGDGIDAAWREEYAKLSDYTRQRHSYSHRCPRAFYQRVNREIVDGLHARHHGGKRAVRKLIGGLHGDRWADIPTFHSWVMDDVTSNIEVEFTNPDGSKRLGLPQIICVMDGAARKIVGLSSSDDKAPTADLVFDAAEDAFKKTGKVPKELWTENGYVFGKSLLINGKEDEQGRMVVVGLAQYGCTVHHFGKMNPQAKAELERSFEALQRLMERHPGYTGRHQMIDAPEEFKREQRLILSGKVPATKYRYTFEEFKIVLDRLINEYNVTPNRGEHMKGLTPNEAFMAMQSVGDPPIDYDSALAWYFQEKNIVTVGIGGVRFQHRSSGRTIRVRGGRLVNLVGKELWAWMDRKDPSMVTFMNLNFTDPFTLEVCQTPSAREHSMAPDSGILSGEISKIREHERAVDDQYHHLIEQFGNPRQQLLAEIRKPPVPGITSTITDGVRRVVVMNGQLAESGEQMQQQRAEIREAKNKKAHRTAANKSKARRLGIPTVLVDDDEQSRRALELRSEARRGVAVEIETTEGTES